MDNDLIQATRTLSRGDTARVDERPGARLLVIRGCLWLTRHSDPADYVLYAGDSFLLEESRLMVVTALEDSAFTVLDSRSESEHAAPLRLDQSLIERHRLHAEAMRSRYLAKGLDKILTWGAEAAGAVRDWLASRWRRAGPARRRGALARWAGDRQSR